MLTPAGELALRTTGANAWIGWPDIPRIEKLREEWLDAPNLLAQQKITQDIQAVTPDKSSSA